MLMNSCELIIIKKLQIYLQDLESLLSLFKVGGLEGRYIFLLKEGNEWG